MKFTETAGLLPAKYYLSLHAGEPKWDVRENLFMRQKYLEKMNNSIKKDFVEEEGYQVICFICVCKKQRFESHSHFEVKLLTKIKS